MNTGKTVFSQVMEFLPLYEFRKCVQRYQGEYKARSFSCMDQFFMHGLRATDVSRKFAQYRIVPAIHAAKALPYGFSRPNIKKHISRCKQSARLAYLCRLCPGVNSTGQKTVFQRTFWRRIKAGGLRVDATTIDLCLSLFPWALKDQSRGKTAYAPGSTRQYPDIYPNHRRKSSRCQHPGHHYSGSRLLLYYGQGLHRFCPALCPASRQGVFHRARQIQYSMPKALFSPCGQNNRIALRPNDYFNHLSVRQGLSGKNSALSNFSMPSTING